MGIDEHGWPGIPNLATRFRAPCIIGRRATDDLYLEVEYGRLLDRLTALPAETVAAPGRVHVGAAIGFHRYLFDLPRRPRPNEYRTP